VHLETRYVVFSAKVRHASGRAYLPRIRLIPIEGVVAVWKSPALSSGLAIVDEVSEPTRGSHRGVRVIR